MSRAQALERALEGWATRRWANYPSLYLASKELSRLNEFLPVTSHGSGVVCVADVSRCEAFCQNVY